MNNGIPVLNEASIQSLTDAQIVEWYQHHPNPTVRALVHRLHFIIERERGSCVNAYQDGFYAGVDHSNPHNLTPDELRLATAYVE